MRHDFAYRHCEERLRRSNPFLLCRSMDCFAALAMTVSCSMTLKIVERFAAVLAAPQRLAGSRTELGQHFGIFRAALRARHPLHAEQRAAGACSQRRRNAVFPQLAAAF